jgi:hypothetical protein
MAASVAKGMTAAKERRAMWLDASQSDTAASRFHPK